MGVLCFRWGVKMFVCVCVWRGVLGRGMCVCVVECEGGEYLLCVVVSGRLSCVFDDRGHDE